MRGGGGVGHADSDRVTGAVTVHSLHPGGDGLRPTLNPDEVIKP